MKTILIPAVLALAFGPVACQTTPSRSETSQPVTSTTAVRPYPLKTCLVTDEDLDSMGGAVTMVHNGQEVKFCCKSCVKKFEKEPDTFLAKLR